MSEMSEVWRKAFATWPTTFRRKGVVVPADGEPVPFCDFVMSETILVLERPTPDTSGARRVAVPFDRIQNLKYTEPLKTEQFLKAGFVKEMPAELPHRPSPVANPAPLPPTAAVVPAADLVTMEMPTPISSVTFPAGVGGLVTLEPLDSLDEPTS